MLDQGTLRIGLSFAAGCAVLTFAGGAMAQDASQLLTAPEYDRGRNVSVLQRERPDYVALGVPAGGFTVFPKLDASIAYESNIFATKVNKESAAVFRVNPSVDALSNWGRHQLRASAGLKLREVINHSDENETGWYARGFGRLDIHGQSYATATLDAQRSYQDRLESEFPVNAAKPIPYTAVGGTLRGVYQADRLRASVGGDIHTLNYSDVPTVTGGTLDNRGRDNTSYKAEARLEYAISPDTALFVRPGIGKIDYKTTGGVFGPSRNSNDYSVLAGANFDVTALVRGEVGVGYSSRKYESPAFGRISGFAMAGKVEYFPTQLTTVTLDGHRRVTDSIISGSAGYFDTGVGLTVDHELHRNVLVRVKGDYYALDYRGIDRSDRVYAISGGGTYLLSHTVGLNGSVSYLKRTSSGANLGREYDDVIVSLGLVLQR
jgi:hypothetical protein